MTKAFRFGSRFAAAAMLAALTLLAQAPTPATPPQDQTPAPKPKAKKVWTNDDFRTYQPPPAETPKAADKSDKAEPAKPKAALAEKIAGDPAPKTTAEAATRIGDTKRIIQMQADEIEKAKQNLESASPEFKEGLKKKLDLLNDNVKSLNSDLAQYEAWAAELKSREEAEKKRKQSEQKPQQ